MSELEVMWEDLLKAETREDLDRAVFGMEIPAGDFRQWQYGKWQRALWVSERLVEKGGNTTESMIDFALNLAALLMGDGRWEDGFRRIDYALGVAVQARALPAAKRAFVVGWGLTAFMAMRRPGLMPDEMMAELGATSNTLGEFSKRLDQGTALGSFLSFAAAAFTLISQAELLRRVKNEAGATDPSVKEMADTTEANANLFDQLHVAEGFTGFGDWFRRFCRKFDL